MTQRLKNTSIENGFARNPDRVYYEDFFEKLPGTLLTYTFSSADVITKTVSQPANTFLKEVYVLCSTAVAIANGSNMGIIVQKDGSNKYVDGTTNLINSGSSIALDSCFVIPTSARTTSFTNAQRNIDIKITPSGIVSSGTLKVIPVFQSVSVGIGMNSNYLLSGTGTPQANYLTNIFSAISLKTSGAANNNSVLFPNTDYPDSPVSSGCLKPGSKIEMEATVIIPASSKDNISVVCGLRKTNPSTNPLQYDTDDSQAYFAFGQPSPLVGGTTISSSSNWLFIYTTAADKHYITDLGVPVVADREYHLRIEFNKTRHIAVFINGVQYGLTSTQQSGSTYGVTESRNYNLSEQMGTVALYPMIAIQTTSGAKEMYINYVKLSRTTKKSYDA